MTSMDSWSMRSFRNIFPWQVVFTPSPGFAPWLFLDSFGCLWASLAPASIPMFGGLKHLGTSYLGGLISPNGSKWLMMVDDGWWWLIHVDSCWFGSANSCGLHLGAGMIVSCDWLPSTSAPWSSVAAPQLGDDLDAGWRRDKKKVPWNIRPGAKTKPGWWLSPAPLKNMILSVGMISYSQ